MKTFFHPRPNYFPEKEVHTHAKPILYVVPAARFFFSLIFILSGFNHFSSSNISYAVSMGVPMADILVPVSGLLSLIGGLSVLFGMHARAGATLLLIFLVPVTLIMHQFWNVADPMIVQMQLVNFLKNLGLIGGALMIVFYGAGPMSVDQHERKKGRSA